MKKEQYKKFFGTWLDWIWPIAEKELPAIWTFLKETRSTGKTIFPYQDNIFRAFSSCPFDDVKVVIIGQDPYFNERKGVPVASGFAFASNVEGFTPPSLRNIIMELEGDIYPNHFDGERFELSSVDIWGSRQARQGVLLLNTALTVNHGEPASHTTIWTPFIESVITELSSTKEHIVWILWGDHAKKYKKFIDTEKHTIIEGIHPSPLSAHRGFFGQKYFSRTNEALISHNQTPITW